MSTEADFVRIVRLHNRRADGYTLTQVLILVLFTGIYVLFNQAGMSASERTGVFVLLGTMILATVIWQAAGLGVARVHMLLDRMDLLNSVEARRCAANKTVVANRYSEA